MQRRDSNRTRVLRELELITQGKHRTQQTLLKRYLECPDWQNAAQLLLNALHSSPEQAGRSSAVAAARFDAAHLMPAGAGLTIPRIEDVPVELQIWHGHEATARGSHRPC
jgi:hypothetical protein